MPRRVKATILPPARAQRAPYRPIEDDYADWDDAEVIVHAAKSDRLRPILKRHSVIGWFAIAFLLPILFLAVVWICGFALMIALG